MTNRIVKHTVAGLMALTLTAGCLTGTAATGKNFGLTSVTAGAVTEKSYSNFTYRDLDDGTVEMTSYYGYSSSYWSFIIPDKLDDKIVSRIADGAFKRCYNLSKVTIPSTVRSIGENAFDSCSLLSSIVIDSENEYYSSVDGVLYDKAQTTLIYCPKRAGRSITVPDTVTTIRNHAFDSAIVNGAINIPASVTSIGERAFFNAGFSSFDVDEDNPYYCSVDGVLFDKDKTTLMQFPKTKKDISFPSTLTAIGDGAFYDNRKIENVVIPNGVKSIGDKAFGLGYILSSISIPASVTDISSTAFINNQFLSIEVDSENPVYSSENGALFNKDKTAILSWSGIGRSAVIPDGVTAIGDHAFELYMNMETVTIPDSVKTIGAFAFSKCSNLRNVVIPEGVESIGEEAFSDCGNLTTVSIPASAADIGKRAFSRSWLTDINVDSANPNFSSVDGVFYNKDKTVLIQCPRLKNKINIPDTVTEIADYALYYCNDLTKVVIPDGVTLIGDHAFYDCGNLKSVNMPSSLKELKDYAFASTAITEFILPECLTKLGNYSLAFCGLKRVALPYSICEIGERCITNCDKITYPGSVSQWRRVELATGNDVIRNFYLGYRNPYPDYERGNYSVKMSWKKLDAAEEYGIVAVVQGRWRLVATVPNDTCEYMFRGLKTGEYHRVGLITKINGEWETQFTYKDIPPLDPVTHPVTTVETGENAFRLTWKAVPTAKSYGIACYQGGRWRMIRSEIPAGTTVFTMRNVPSGTYKAVVLAKMCGEWDTSDLQSRIFEIEIK